MSDQYPLVGVTPNWRKPGSYIQTLYAQGQPAGQQGQRDILMIAAMVSGGNFTANTLIQATSESQVIAGLGIAGCFGHRMYRKIVAANQQTKIWILPYAETTGGSPVAASTTITVAGSATSQAVATLQICGVQINALINSSQTNINAADTFIANINTATFLPVTATGTGSGTIILTCKQKGTLGGTSTYKPIRLDLVQAPGNGITISVPGDLGQTTPGADGTTATAAAIATAVASISPAGRYYVVYDCGGDTTANSNVCSWLLSQDLPLQGHAMQAVTAYNGTKANGITLATARNYERLQIVWAQNSDHDPAELAANMVALRQKYEDNDAAFIFKDYARPDWQIMPAWDTATWPIPSDINDAINGGLTPVEYKTGYSTIVMSVNTRTKDATGTYIDFRAAETHRISIGDFCEYDMNGRLSIAMTDATGGAKKLVDDPKLPNNKVDYNRLAQEDFKKKMCPALIAPLYKKAFADWENANLTQRVPETIASLNVNHSGDNRGRVNAGYTLYTVDGWLQTTTLVSEGTPG